MRAYLRTSFVLLTLALIAVGGCKKAVQSDDDDEPRRAFRGLEASLTVDAEPALLPLHQGGKGKLKVAITRRAIQGPIVLEMQNLPADVTAPKVTVPPGQTSAEIELTVAPTAGSGERTDTIVAATAGAGLKATSPKIRVTIKGAPFTITTDLAVLKVSQGTKAKVKVTASRKGYTGPIAVELVNLPPNMEVTKRTIPEGKDSAELEVGATAGTPAGDRPGVQVQGLVSTPAATYRDFSNKFTVSVQPPPFSLQVEPATVNLPQAGKALLKIHAVRKTYQGPITLELRNLPAGVTVPKFTIAAYLKSDDVPVTATLQVPLGVKGNIQVVGTANSETYQAMSPPFALNIQPGLVLQLEPGVVKVAQGGKVKFKVTPVRTGYNGPVEVELIGLPTGLSAPKVTIPSFKRTDEMELTAAGTSALQPGARIQAVARAPEANNQQLATADLTAIVVEAGSIPPGPFGLKVQPAVVKLSPGGKATLRVTAIRKEYDGPIAVEVRSLPMLVTAAKGTIAEKQATVDIELTAAATAALGDKTDVTVASNTLPGMEIVSPSFTVSVQPRGFELRASPTTVRLTPGSSEKLKVHATRRTYQGPIALELKNLPPGVRAAKAALPAGQNEAEIEVSADDAAAPVTKYDAHVIGTADREQATTSPITIHVGAGLFDLRLEPPLVKLKHGASAKLKVTATRKGYAGAIPITMKNLPYAVTIGKASIAKGEDAAEVEVTAGFEAAEGDTVDVQAVGGATGSNRQVLSSCVTISVMSVGQQPFEVKLDSAVAKVTQGATTKIKVTVARFAKYEGPVVLEMRNLPMGVSATRVTVPMKQNTAEIELTAQGTAAAATKSDVCVVGTASGAGKQALASPHIALTVVKK